jgi:ABC-type Fe3+ transport system substrate-binding protein
VKKNRVKLSWLLLVAVLAILLSACGSEESNGDQTGTNGGSEETGQTGGSDTEEAEEQNDQGDQEGQEASTSPEWEELIKAAQEEGELVIYGQVTEGREKVINYFSEKFGINVIYPAIRPGDATNKVMSEFEQGQYLTDIMMENGQAVNVVMYPAGVVEDIRDYMILPEVLGDEYWHGGFEQGFEMADNTNQYVFGVMPYPIVYINHDVIPEGEITSFEDLLDPKWKGKILFHDYTFPGSGNSGLTTIALEFGKDYAEKLIEQKGFISSDNRLTAEEWATGSYPIAVGLHNDHTFEFIEKGVVKNWSILRPEVSGVLHGLSIAVLKNPPHPNATKLFVNWFLGPEGQQMFVDNALTIGQSRRTDVKENPNDIGWDQMEYRISTLEKEAIEIREWAYDLPK